MITNFLLDNSALVPLALVLVAVVCVTVGYLLARSRFGRRALVAMIVASAVPVVVLTLVPTSTPRSEILCVVQFALPTFGTVELLANVALLFPLTFFAALATRRPVVVFAAGAGISAAIEAVQALVPGIGRACDTNDWLMNTIGAAAAVALARATIALVDRVPARARD
ncbi:hypothetical protein BLA60_08045 [Actinophytocola xinjiangensis]|uniref:VanZ-like domain-containing protein n=1 Tax=Actinophytocola xinjiangensis TaxID=485602 RepID=A0A7Z0WS90_9PSEU|nr:VanZ family protein [Actinophytocola xinjiangensis]OLF11976.1 hypothetical protein BLA60_08045 [Actinophytocola xinjiangensis]